jgi:monoamine oxidase
MISVEIAAQEQRVEGGTGLIPQRLAEKVGYEHILLNAPVASIKKGADSFYTVVSAAGTVKACKVVLALAPPLQKSITFSPPLPKERKALNDKMTMGAVGKGIAVYATPFWRTEFGGEGLNAQVLSDTGSSRVTFDNSPSNASFGAVLGFIFGDEMRALDHKSEAEVQAAVTSDYVRYFGEQARDTTELVVQRWDLEEWSKGGPVAHAPPRVLVPYGAALRKPVEGLHFAGTETGEYWTGYMDGAIRSGERVAREILGGL